MNPHRKAGMHDNK